MPCHTQLLTVASIWLVAAVSPGPNFLLTAQIAAAQSRARGLAAVAGIALATAIWGLCGLTGVQALFLAAPWAYAALKVGGAAYLVIMGLRLIINAQRRAEAKAALSGPLPTPARAFTIGLVTSLANPRSALSVASLFAAALPPDPSFPLGAATVATMVAISVIWYACVVYLFASGAVADAYARARRWIDRVAGGLLVLFGVKLAMER
jgi:threonine efflux protein